MQDRPEAEELAAALAQFLLDEVRPAVPRELRFQLLVAANTAAILAREAAGEETAVADGRARRARRPGGARGRTSGRGWPGCSESRWATRAPRSGSSRTPSAPGLSTTASRRRWRFCANRSGRSSQLPIRATTVSPTTVGIEGRNFGDASLL